MATFAFVSGAWLGGWCWRDVARHLRANGHMVLCPTLTCLGDRAFDEPIRLNSTEAAGLPRAFVRTTPSELYERLISRARAAGWYCRQSSGGHYAMCTEPADGASALGEVPLQVTR
jgi:hypothetical protein